MSSFMGVTSYTNVYSKNVLEGEINDFILNGTLFGFVIYYLLFTICCLLLNNIKFMDCLGLKPENKKFENCIWALATEITSVVMMEMYL
jgi:hypothetical protein